MRGLEKRAPVNRRGARRVLVRALVAVGGSIAGTAAAWALSSGIAAADELPDATPSVDHTVSSDHAASTGHSGASGHSGSSATADLLSAPDKLTGQLDGHASSLPKPDDLSSVVRPATDAVHRVDTTVHDAAARQSEQRPALSGVGSDVHDGLRNTARDAGDKLSDGLRAAGGDLQDNIDSQLEPITRPLKPVTQPLRPITTPLAPVPVPGLGGAPPAHLPAPADPPAAAVQVPRQDAVTTGHAPIAPHQATHAPNAKHGDLHFPAGGLPFPPLGDSEPLSPLTLPGGSGSTGHDSYSGALHGPLAGEQSDVPLLPDPALVQALIPDEDRLNVNLAEQPGTTPD